MNNSPSILTVPGHTLPDMSLADRVDRVLKQHYPGHPWHVFLNDEVAGGVLDIYNYAVSYHWGYRLKLSTVYQDPNLRCVIRAGGEILERGEKMRGRWDEVDAEHIDGIPEHQQPVGGIIIV